MTSSISTSIPDARRINTTAAHVIIDGEMNYYHYYNQFHQSSSSDGHTQIYASQFPIFFAALDD